MVAIGTKIPFFRVLVTFEPGRSLLQFVTTNCLIDTYFMQGLLQKVSFIQRRYNYLKSQILVVEE